MLLKLTRLRPPRRGVTLIEMLVTVALLVLMMSVIVQVFTAATGAVSNARAFQELDGSLRQIDATLRTDLQNITAKLTPPLNPKDNLGYFEYGENSFADAQGEDSDDYLRFTVKAPEGQLFTGRMFVAPHVTFGNMSQAQRNEYLSSQPMTITSQYAEVIYFLRNGNLYRRVLLVKPELQTAVSAANQFAPFTPGSFGGNLPVSWQGMNDLSAHPTATYPVATGGRDSIELNTLGHLTNRENRFGYSRFASDYDGDGIPDDTNFDTVHDFTPNLYWNIWNAVRAGQPFLLNEPGTVNRSAATADTMAFPYVFAGAYSTPHAASASLGWIYAPDPGNSQNTITLLNQINHNPVDVGDSLQLPTTAVTWWGFPTWRETLHQFWTDPNRYVAAGQANGLHTPNSGVAATLNLLPPMTTAPIPNSTAPTPYRLLAQPNNDGTGSPEFAVYPAPFAPDQLWRQAWEDDLVLTGVRSFDVKAYDNTYAGYVDLGWGDDGRLWAPYLTTAQINSWTPPLVGQIGAANPVALGFTWPPNSTSVYHVYRQTYAHEGRIPPLLFDGRPDYQFPTLNANNLGDDNTSVVRLRRVWDSWSTDYSHPVATGVDVANGSPVGPPFTRPVVPSYPPPYEMPLRGIQIQIRVTDPRNERVKVLTIRQDFSDKL
jgi:prepilin-type N-terminal cleavage/methylation domain-containing protein